MSDSPLISILVPAYNHEKFVEQTLYSILENDYPSKELVIINDGSKDSTDTVIKSWIENNRDKIDINYLSRENRGVTKTLNELVTRSNGEYVTVIASDDYLLAESLKIRRDYLHSHPDKMAVFADCIVVDGESNKTHDSGISELHYAKKERFATDEGLKRELILAWSVPGGTLMARRSMYDTFRYDERYLIEDLDMFLKMTSRDWLGFIDRPVSAYRVHGNNACMQDESWVKVQSDIVWSYARNLKRFSPLYQFYILFPLWDNLLPILKYKLKKLLGMK